jgi:glycosyltransferase involved in cell wall biosynthesis
MGDEIERLAITNAKRLIYPSSWAARSAIEDYGADPLKVHIIPLGANFDVPPSREDATRFHQRDVCRLLFVGVSWERKGGDIAFETLLELLRLGVPSELIVVGCQPPPHVSHNRLRVFPFLNKNNPEECKLLYTLYYQSDFFVLPTRAECFGIVLCEANAFGLPVLSTETGGVSEIVRNGVNGFLLPLEARGDRYAAVIRDIYDDSTRYADLRKSSRGEFESRLNWDAWGRQVCEIFRVAVNTLPHE